MAALNKTDDVHARLGYTNEVMKLENFNLM